VLQQQKKKAALRVKGGRARPIDWLAVTLRFIDSTRDLLDDEVEDHELDIVDPEGVLEGLSEGELSDLQKEIDDYLTLESNKSNREYWDVCFFSLLRKVLGTLLMNIGTKSALQRSPAQIKG
jgi:hypothetical protein